MATYKGRSQDLGSALLTDACTSNDHHYHMFWSSNNLDYLNSVYVVMTERSLNIDKFIHKLYPMLHLAMPVLDSCSHICMVRTNHLVTNNFQIGGGIFFLTTDVAKFGVPALQCTTKL